MLNARKWVQIALVLKGKAETFVKIPRVPQSPEFLWCWPLVLDKPRHEL